MKEFVLKATPKNKQLVFKNPEWFEQALKQFDGKEIKVIIKRDICSRSDRQNRYYWAYLHIIEEETGNDSESMHEYFKRIFLPPRFIKAFGKEIKIPSSTAKLDKLEFTDYIKKIEVETGILAPDTDVLFK